MVVYRRVEDVTPVTNSVVTIGSFDGLHRGHQEVIATVVTTAHALNERSVVITFDPHPKQVLRSGHPFELLMQVKKKLQLLEAMGVDTTLVIPFDMEFSKTTASRFLDEIVMNYFDPSYIIVGYDHRFGHNREGDSEFLRRYANEGHFRLEMVSGVGDQDVIVSSTRIRTLIREGHVRRASFDLGWQFGFDVVVVHGSGRGFSLSFPTANFVPKNDGQLLPQTGVYFARATINDQYLYGMCNIGYRPTFGEKEFVMEIHFFDGNLDGLYGQTMEVQFLERIRDEKAFRSAEALVKQLEKDKAFCLGRIHLYKEV